MGTDNALQNRSKKTVNVTVWDAVYDILIGLVKRMNHKKF